MIKIFASIMTYFLTIIALNLAKIQLFFGLLILLFNADSIDTSDRDFSIFITKLRALIIF